MEDIIQLGGNIQLNGFSELDGATMVVLKKVIGNYAKQFNEKCSKFEKLIIKLNEGTFNAEVINEGNSIISEAKDNNLFFAVDKALKEIENKI